MNSKTIIEKIAVKLGMKDFKFAEEFLNEIILDSGDVLYIKEELTLGGVVYDDSEMTKPVSDGPYNLADGTKFDIIDGVIGVLEVPEVATEATEEVEAEVTVEDPATTEVSEEEEVIKVNAIESTDGVILYFEDGIELAVDSRLFLDEKLTTPADQNEYSTVDGLILTLKAGIVTNIETVMVAFSKLKQSIIDIEDAKNEFQALVEQNESLIKQINELKKEKVSAPATESLNFSELIVETVEKTKLSRSEVKESLNKIFNK